MCLRFTEYSVVDDLYGIRYKVAGELYVPVSLEDIQSRCHCIYWGWERGLLSLLIKFGARAVSR